MCSNPLKGVGHTTWYISITTSAFSSLAAAPALARFISLQTMPHRRGIVPFFAAISRQPLFSSQPTRRLFRTTSINALPSLSIRNFAPKVASYKVVRSNIAPPDHPLPRRIAVVGAGLAGLAVTYHLLNSTARYARKRSFDHTSLRITIFDPVHPGTGGASSAAAGLLHEFRPRPKSKVWNHQKGIDAALHLLAKAETLGQKLVTTPGLLKFALDEAAFKDMRTASRRYPREVELLQPDEVQRRFPHIRTNAPALFIRPAHVVDTASYMRALWKLCEESGRVSWCQQEVSSLSELFNPPRKGDSQSSESPFLGPFDNVVLCNGAAIKSFTELSDVPVQQVVGRNLIMESTCAEAPQLPIMGGQYVVPDLFDNMTCPGRMSTQPGVQVQTHGASRFLAGATFENLGYEKFHQTTREHLDPGIVAQTQDRIGDRLQTLMPDMFSEWDVVGMSAGTRAVPPRTRFGSVPIACQVQDTPIDRSCWILSGLGARGLLYHAFLGRRLAHAIVAGNARLIPGEAREVEVRLKEPFVSSTVSENEPHAMLSG